jgi:hypothetical protein
MARFLLYKVDCTNNVIYQLSEIITKNDTVEGGQSQLKMLNT